ncbi:lipopolysaccharide biosynthesis protein [Devosia nitrariae]|uniref:Lipopolysaccharide biosynthesis protein n=1 Tax=Devosia nitrariae TaxID=2071872 RepID=A0ABQ5WDD1_9HYPH|nr:lipopolysaccharide biosynthesis protein [Devosia nitrariae]
MVWSVLGNIGNNLVSFVVFALVARLVEPGDIGVLAVAMVFIEMGKVFVYAGVPDLIVRQKVWDEGYAMMCFWLNLAAALISAVLVVVLVGPAVEASFAPGITPILAVLVICFVIDSIRVVPESKLRRSFDYKSLARRGVGANLIAGVLAIALALLGWGVWALVVQRVASSLFTTILTLVAARWLPSGVGSWRGFVPALGHGAGLVGGSMLKLLSDRLPDLLFGFFLGPAAVGIFRVGARGFEALVQFAVHPVRSASLSTYAAANAQTGKLENSLLHSLASASLFTFPVFYGAAAVSTEFVQLVFGPQWSASAVIMATLCLTCPPLVLSALLQSALSAQHKTSAILRLNAANATTTVAVLLIGIPTLGLVGTTAALTGRSYLGMVFNIMVTVPGVGLRMGDVFRAVFPPLVGSTLFLVGVSGMQNFVPMPPLLQLLSSVGLGVVIYLAAMLLLFRRFTLRTLSFGEQPLSAAIRKIFARLNFSR